MGFELSEVAALKPPLLFFSKWRRQDCGPMSHGVRVWCVGLQGKQGTSQDAPEKVYIMLRVK